MWYSIVIQKRTHGKGNVIVKKYLVRIIGALCILGALALIFMPACMSLDGVMGRDLRDLRKDVNNMTDEAKEAFLYELEDSWNSEVFEEELEDSDLPSRRSGVKAYFKEIDGLVDTALAGTYALKDVLVLSIKAPGLVEDMENLVDSSYVSKVFFGATAEYVVYQEYYKGNLDRYDEETVDSTTQMYMDAAEDSVEVFSELTFIFTLVTGVLVLIIVIGVASAVGQIFDKTRWIKYLFLVLLICLVTGFCIAGPLVTGVVEESMELVPAFEDMSLKVTATPFMALVLAIVPVVLDIIFERKKNKKTEE